MKFYAYKNLVRRSVDLLLVEQRGGRQVEGQPVSIMMKVIEDEDLGRIREPTLSIPHEGAQALLQALWDEGFRPETGEGGTAEVAALKAHIRFAEGVTGALLGRSSVNGEPPR